MASIRIKSSTSTALPPNLNIAEPAYSYVSNTLFLGTATSDGVIAIGGKFYVDQQQIIYNTANAAFLQANSSTGSLQTTLQNNINTVDAKATAAFLQANAVFVVANSGGAAQANAAFNTANAAFIVANTALLNAGSASIYANGAFASANIIDTKVASASVYSNGAFVQANTAVSNALSASNYANGAFTAANTAGVSPGNYANAAFVVANTSLLNAASASIYANGAFASANAIDSKVNNASTYANGAFVAANTADAKAVTSGSYANSAYTHANAAFDKANTAIAGNFDPYARALSNSASDTANTSLILAQFAANTANSAAGASLDITARNTANAAFLAANNASDLWVRNQANSAFIQANTAVNNALSASNYANGAFAKANTNNLTISLIDTVGNISNVVSNVTTLRFDSDSGFDVNSLSQGIVKVGMNSTFKYWKIDGVTYLTAQGIDTINLLPSNGITITANGNSSPQSIQFDGSIIFDKANAAFTQANGAFAAANASTATDATQNNSITVALNTANAAFIAANNALGGTADQTARNTANAAFTAANNASSSATGNTITLGSATDGSLSNVGAYTGWTTTTKVTDAIDDLNEMMDNVRANTFVKSVTFSASPAAAGSGSTITLTLAPVTSNGTIRYDIDWGDNSFSNNATGISQTHVYSAQGSKTIIVRAYNPSGAGTGSEASNTSAGIVVIYTADPTMGYSFFRTLTGGTALTAAAETLYVTEGETFYLQNDTTNTTGSAVTYITNFGDGAANTSIASDTAAGGVFGARLPYTYGFTSSSGTSRLTANLVLTSSNTANPASIPRSIATALIKVYDANIAPPNGLSTKTITFSNGAQSSATSGLLAANFANNAANTCTSVAGLSVTRNVATTGNVSTVVLSSIAYNANSGILNVLFNGANSGAYTLTSGTDVGSYNSLTISTKKDYQYFDATGTAAAFASTIYSPSRYAGFTAIAQKAAASVPVGLNTLQIGHSANGSTNLVEFVKDDLTSVPTVTAGTLSTQTTGTYRYISGIPYFDTGSPTLNMTGATITNWIGQVYLSSATPVTIVSGTNQEGTSASAITQTSYTYAGLTGGVPYLVGGIPGANTGKSSAYTFGTLNFPIASGVRTVEKIGISATNINGASSTVENSTILNVHSTAQTGISEIAVIANTNLGSTYTDNGIRSTWFKSNTSNTPIYTTTTNFYSTQVYSESSDPGVAGTKEATVRLGTIKHDVTNWSTGYLPAGPDRSADTGLQYFTFAFRRTAVSSFDINITSTTGISGAWIAAPGTAIDSSSAYNGWMLCNTTKAAAGYPGSLGGGNGNDGCAVTDADRIISGSALSGGYTMSLGTQNMSGATNNVVLVRFALSAGQSISYLSVGVAA